MTHPALSQQTALIATIQRASYSKLTGYAKYLASQTIERRRAIMAEMPASLQAKLAPLILQFRAESIARLDDMVRPLRLEQLRNTNRADWAQLVPLVNQLLAEKQQESRQ